MSFCNCFLQKRPCRPAEKIDSYAQYMVRANPSSESLLPMTPLFQEGSLVTLNNDTEIRLAPGYLYLINYLFTATPEADGYMQITPRINGALSLLYSFFAPSGSGFRDTSASGSFTTNTALDEAAFLNFRLSYPESVRNIDISGAVSVTPLLKR